MYPGSGLARLDLEFDVRAKTQAICNESIDRINRKIKERIVQAEAESLQCTSENPLMIASHMFLCAVQAKILTRKVCPPRLCGDMVPGLL